MNHGHEFDTALSKERKAEQERKQKEREARKRLETAAPDLLDACKLLVHQDIWGDEEFPADSPVGKGQAAIAKAEQK